MSDETTPRPHLEIAVTSPGDARTARDHGADRVELCCALELGGLTPPPGVTDAVLELDLPVYALVRPRPGDFRYDRDEVDVMVQEVRSLVHAGVDGLVVGALTDRGEVDVETVRRLLDAATSSATAPLDLAFHRAVDHTVDPVAAVRTLAALGVGRVLSSGGSAWAADGARTLARMHRAAPDLHLTAGGGVRAGDVPVLLAAGADAVHLSAKRPIRAAGPRAAVALGAAGTDPNLRWVVDPALVAAARVALDVADRRR